MSQIRPGRHNRLLMATLVQIFIIRKPIFEVDDRRRAIAFESNRDGNYEIYVLSMSK